jgi:hypothetical protein
MGAIVTTCRRCGKDFEPEPEAIARGQWRTCPACTAQPPSEPEAVTHCEGCGRPLKAAGRTWCYACLTGLSGV